MAVFMIMCFGLGSFIPLKVYPASVTEIINMFPISGLINNTQLILSNQAVSLYYFIVSMLLNALLLVILSVLIHKTYRD